MKHFTESTPSRFKKGRSIRHALDDIYGGDYGSPSAKHRCEMPVAAAFAFYAAVTAEVVTVFTVITAIGSAMALVGSVTGDELFAKVGGALTLVGGFGALAQGGAFGDGAMKDWATDTNASIMGTQAPAPISDAIVNNVSSAGVTGGDIVSQVAGEGSMSGANALTDANLQQSTGLMDTYTTPGFDENGFGIGQSAAVATDPASSALQAEFANGGTIQNAAQAAAAQGGNVAAVKTALGTGIDTGVSLFDRILAFSDKHPTVTQAALTGISKAYQSPQDRALKEAQTSSANAASGLYDVRAAEISGNMANANAIPTVRGMQVNPNAQIYNQKPVVSAPVLSTGLIQTRSMT